LEDRVGFFDDIANGINGALGSFGQASGIGGAVGAVQGAAGVGLGAIGTGLGNVPGAVNAIQTNPGNFGASIGTPIGQVVSTGAQVVGGVSAALARAPFRVSAPASARPSQASATVPDRVS
jgi:hypothetical protein